MSLIHEALRKGDLIDLRRLVSCGLDLEALDDAENTPLMLACQLPDAPLEAIRLLLDRGADPNHRSSAGYTAVIHAACANRIDVIEILHHAGADLDGASRYGESALSVLSRMGRFDDLSRLMEWGADPEPLGWTMLHLAAAYASPDVLTYLLDDGAIIEASDFWERTPLLVAIHAGKIENASYLLERGANRAATGRCGKTAMHYPLDHDDVLMLRWLLDRGFPADAVDDFGETPLMLAVEHSAVGCFEALVDEGAEWERIDGLGEPLITKATHPEIIRRLVELGQDAKDLGNDVLRVWIGLGIVDGLPVTEAEFHSGRSHRFGTANPERMDVPFWNAMVRNGWAAWKAADQFDHISYGLNDPVWSHDRFGMSLTPLPDGRWVQIAGEHEDHYDPDFCIYNDVVVHDGKGGFEIFGYPEDVFPPTDFHSATLVGEWIYVIGNLGYPGSRRPFPPVTPVFRLHIGDWHIERVPTEGKSPGWIFEHQAKLEGDSIRIFNARRFYSTPAGRKQKCDLIETCRFDLVNRTWQF